MPSHKPPLSRSGKTEFIRMIRYKSENQIGVLLDFVSAIAGQGGSIGDVTTRKLGKFYIWRDVTIIANDREHFGRILKAIHALDKTVVEQIIDEVLERHQGGKIKMELNHPIETINDMRAVYTPGVADVCRLIQQYPSEAYNYLDSPHRRPTDQWEPDLGVGEHRPLGCHAGDGRQGRSV